MARHKSMPGRNALATAVVLVFSFPAHAENKASPLQKLQFDADVLIERGINPRIAEYFKTAQRFTPGMQSVQFSVNGNSVGRKSALFDDDGNLCFTPELVQSIGLLPMDGSDAPAAADAAAGIGYKDLSPTTAERCPDYRAFASRTLVSPQPGVSAVDITVPAEYVRGHLKIYNVSRGGVGGMFNYRGYATNSRLTAGDSEIYQYRYLDTTAGFNAGDWIFRSYQDYSTSGGTGQYAWRSAYVQKSFEEQKQVLQAGRITTQSPLFGGLPITGAQWFPERALYAAQINVAVTGVARSRARVEIRQNGILLLNTLVPAGPFSLSNYSLHNRSADLEVKVTEDAGAEQDFTVPAASLVLASGNAQFEGWNIAAGQFWDQSQRHVYRESPVVSISKGWARGYLSGTAGGVLAPDYSSVGASAIAAFPEQKANVYGQVLVTRDSRHGANGALASIAGGKSFGPDLQAGISGNMRGSGYRSLQETLAYRQPLSQVSGGYRTQLSGSLSWNAGIFGSLSAGLTQERYFLGEAGHIATVSWSKGWTGGISATAGFAHRTARISPTDLLNLQAGDSRQAGSNYLYFSLSVPLGTSVNSRTYFQRTDGVDRLGSGFDQRINPFLGYRASVEQLSGRDTKQSDASLSVYGVPHYTNLAGGINRGRSYESLYAEMSGAVIATADGIALSPYAVQDSFGTVRTGDVRGAKIETPQGPVWSFLNGVAALAALAPYQDFRLEVAGTSIPLDVDVDNGLQVVQAGRGAVLMLNMGMKTVRRKMLIVAMADGRPLAAGAAVLRGTSEYFTASGQGGRVLVSEMVKGDKLRAEFSDGKFCVIEETGVLPRAAGDLFERVTAICE